jgi:hypothetical protein
MTRPTYMKWDLQSAIFNGKQAKRCVALGLEEMAGDFAHQAAHYAFEYQPELRERVSGVKPGTCFVSSYYPHELEK